MSFMKKISLFILLFSAFTSKAQLLSWTPDFIQENSAVITITMNAAFGNKGLLGYTPTNDVYVHIGVITNKSTTSSDWKYVKFTDFNSPNPSALALSLGSNVWRFTIASNIRTYFGITDPTEKVQKISILFRNGAGTRVQRNSDFSDMYIPVYDNGLYARIDNPFNQPTFVRTPEPINKKVGDPLTITAKASQAGTLSIYFNLDEPIAAGTSGTLTANTTITAVGEQTAIAELRNGANVHRDTLKFIVPKANVVAALPPGATDGINYEAGGTSAILVLYAPSKQYVFVTGDFTNWGLSANYQMNITPDGKRYWLRITGLTPGQEYGYQYVVDGSLKIADPYCEKVLDPWNDKFIPTTTYPSLKIYPEGKTSGIVSVLQTNKPAYNWKASGYQRPDKRNLIVYEALIRDFSTGRNWKTLQDSLPYFKRLGINAIHVMPFNEFEGNESWGYNPSYYFAPDKYYGTETAVKDFIDACHLNGVAVIMDMVLNHSFGSSPMVQLYWDAANNRPAANSPWFNPVAKHGFNVGYDFNHDSPDTKAFVKRVLDFWLQQYKIDGFRFDLSKGFTQEQTCDNNGENCDIAKWNDYNLDRVNIWKNIYNDMQATTPGSYCILEHLSDNPEEKELAEYGMMLWGNANFSYGQATMGYSSGWDFSGGFSEARGWNVPHLMTYMESHDEERMMYRNKNFGNISGSYSVKNTATGLLRCGMSASFWAMQPGPKLMWQFGELGYDYSINTCQDGITVKEDCRTANKPVRSDYYLDPNRRALYDTYSLLLKVRNLPQYLSTFTTGNANWSLNGPIKWEHIDDPNLKVMVYGNFDVVNQSGTVTFPATGTWYNLFSNQSIVVNNVNQSVSLTPGEYFVYTSKNVREQVLPVTWLSVSAKKETGGSVLVKWSTGSEIQNEYFVVERSSNAIDYLPIGKLFSLGGSQKNNYQFSDLQPQKGVNYYRIKQVDKDGMFTYSQTVQVIFDGKSIYWSVYPNPVINGIHISVKNSMHNVQLILSDINGKIIYTQNFAQLSAGEEKNINSTGLPKGVYMLTIKSDGETKTERIVVNN
jgi:1,4-alpha-glucan branching enzyme